MGTSPSIPIVLSSAATMSTDESMWNMTPTSGDLPLTCTVVGYVSLSGYPTYGQGDSTPTPVDGETVILQMQGAGGEWLDTGLHMVTGYNAATGIHGYYEGTIVLSAPMLSPGTYSFVIFYAGNATKGLEGC